MSAPAMPVARPRRSWLPVAYARWQLRDALLTRGVQGAVIGLLIGLQLVLPVRLALGEGWAATPDGAQAVGAIVRSLEALLPPLLTLVAVNGIVAGDRRSGHYRLLFSKPVSVAGYYAQAWLALLATVLVVGLALAALFALLVRPTAPATLLAMLLLNFALLGSIGFLLSTVTRFDWLGLGAIWIGSGLAHGAWTGAGGWRGAARLLLPPVHLLEPAHERLRAGALPEAGALLWIAAWTAACVALTLVVVRRRPLGA